MNMQERFNRSALIDGYSQDKFKKKVHVIGCGALGNFVALGMSGYGVESICLYDDDIVEESNLNRQLVFRNEDVGKNKAVALKERIDERIIAGITTTESIEEKITVDNIEFFLSPERVDVAFLCVDNINTRLMINDHLVKNGIPFINGATGGGYHGEYATIIPGKTTCLRCYMKPDSTVHQCSKGKDPSIVSNSILIASFMIAEFQSLMLGMPTTPPAMSFMTGRMIAEDPLDDSEGQEKTPEPLFFEKKARNTECICAGVKP